MLAKDITAQEIELKIGERTVNARFDHNQMRMAELYWQHTARGVLGYIGILDQMIHRTYMGMGAVCYGAVASAAIAAGERPISMDAFDRMFEYPELLRAADELADAALKALPGKKGSAKKAESPA